MKDLCFVSVAFGERYVEQQERLKQSILKIYPQANLNFYTEGQWPKYARPFEQSLYGMKVHAIQEAKDQGFKKIMWLDPAMILCDKVDDVLKYPVIAIRDDHRLTNLISDRCLSFYLLTRESLEQNDWRLVGGSLYYFDFNTEKAESIFYRWYVAEKNGLFGSQREAVSELINGHRNDESCMAIAMYFGGVEPQPGPDVRYCIEKNPIFIKKHFK